MNQSIRTAICLAAVFAAVAVSVSTLLETLWMTLGWPEDATLAFGYWAKPFMKCSFVVALSIGLRSWLIGEDRRPALIFGGILALGSSAQRYGLWLSLPVSLAGVAFYIALGMKLILLDLASLGIGARTSDVRGEGTKAAEPGALP